MKRSMERRVNLVAGALAISAAACLVFAARGPAASASTVREIDPQAAKQLMDRGAVFIDARPRAAFEAAHIPGAFAIPLQELASAMPTTPTIDRSQPIVVYSDGVGSGYEATTRVIDAGFHGAVTLRGGLASWQSAGLPTEAGIEGLLALN